MDTRNDYLFALQLQGELIDFTDKEDTNYIDLTKSTSSSNNSKIVIDLTEFENDIKNHKRNAISNPSHQIKRKCQHNEEVTESIVDNSWETLDPNPDVHGLFLAFNQQYFWGKLSSVVVQWSKRMTTCAGLCKYQRGFCSISLSEPLLKLRPRKDLVETLLHEMIHAYLFLTNYKDHDSRDGHGSEFCKHMYRINKNAGTNISIYHNFHEEVKLYKQHWWKCNGPCQNHKPFYGFVKRSMNRAPSPNDTWWVHHQAVCGGNFIKVKEPEGYGLKKKSTASVISKSTNSIVKPMNKITNFIKVLDSTNKNFEEKNEIHSKSIETDQQNIQSNSVINLANVDETTACPVCNDIVLTDWLNSHLQNCNQLKDMFDNEFEDNCKCPVCNDTVDRSLMNKHLDHCKILSNVFKNNFISIPDNKKYVNCPNCDKMIKEININEHLDICIEVESKKQNVTKSHVNCPCCNKMFNNVIELDDHIDKCF